MKRTTVITALLALMLTLSLGFSAVSGQGDGTLATVRDRGTLSCGVNDKLPGFGFVDADTGDFVGFDVDFCHALAAAIFGDANAVEFRVLNAADRQTALQSGEIDVLIRNTTWTLSRDTSWGDFAPTTFYDGQGVMVRIADGLTSLEDLEGGTICTNQGTTTELNITDQMAARGIPFELVTFQDFDQVMAAFNEARCDAVTTDQSGLISQKSVHSDPSSLVILDFVLSKEPLGPVVRANDSEWKGVVDWVVFGMVNAEEMGISSANVSDMVASEDPSIQRLLGGGDTALGEGLGLSNDFMVNVLSQVGNYGEVFDRNLGPDTVFGLERGVNGLWTEGGILYAPPFR